VWHLNVSVPAVLCCAVDCGPAVLWFVHLWVVQRQVQRAVLCCAVDCGPAVLWFVHLWFVQQQERATGYLANTGAVCSVLSSDVL
jgi:hypothetical protein